MKHRSTRDVVDDLRRGGFLIEVTDAVDPYLEIAEIQRRVYANGGPAVLFRNATGCRFPMVSNLFGSIEQARYLFRHTLDSVRRLIEVKLDPAAAAKQPLRYAGVPLTAVRMLPKSVRSGAVRANRIKVGELPQLTCWPRDGGAFVTLPQVLSARPSAPNDLMQANLGMYRIQLSGNDYTGDEVGLHYQIHRGIGVHHNEALQQRQRLQVCITVGGSPAMTLAAVMPLPEGLSELTFAGALAGHRIGLIRGDHAPIYRDADFAIVGTIAPDQTKPEGPFGDHLGYYSEQHPFPVLDVQQVLHREGAIWPFTVVGRPPQEDTTFGQLIHELTDPIIPTVIPGIKAVHAVDAAGVHPLLLAIGSERYMPYLQDQAPQELLTQSNAVLGNGQLSLAKYLMIVDDPADDLDIHDIEAFLKFVLCRADWRRDLHFQTQTTIDTLDYTGRGFNKGSKLVIAAAGPPTRELPSSLCGDVDCPDGFSEPRVVLPGILAIKAPAFHESSGRQELARFCDHFQADHSVNQFPLITLVDDADFSARSLHNWLWTTFTRSNPATDVAGIEASINDKHWGCRGSLVIDARFKPWQAAPLLEDTDVTAKVDARAARGDELSKYL